jgi:hypothetical protein
MSNPCIRPEELGAVDALAPDDPVRIHLRDCPRCQAQYRAFQSFMKDVQPPPRTALEAEAEAKIAERTRRHFGLPYAERKSADGNRLGRWWNSLSRGARTRFLILTPTVAAAAVVVLLFATIHRPGDDARVLRGRESVATWNMEAAKVLPDGRIRLAWVGKPGADAYRVRVLDTALATLLEETVVGDTTVDIDLSVLGPAAEPGARFLWRVTALHGGENLAESGLGEFRIP